MEQSLKVVLTAPDRCGCTDTRVTLNFKHLLLIAEGAGQPQRDASLLPKAELELLNLLGECVDHYAVEPLHECVCISLM